MSQQQTRADAIEAPQRQLQIEEDLKFQQREWKVQFAGWIAMGLLIILASLGIFGTGPLSSSTAQRADLNLNYERFARLEQPTNLRFQLGGETKEPARLFIERAYLDAVKIDGITPPPDKVEARPGWLVYEFAREGPAAITFHIKPQRFGVLGGRAQLGQAAPITFTQLIYP